MRLLAFALLVLTAAAQPGRAPDRVLRGETVTGRLVGWEMGDYLWARIAVRGREAMSAQPGPDPIGPFLEAHRGRPLQLRIDSVSTYIPEAGGMTEIQRITAARAGRVTASAWWRRLSPAERRAARRRLDRAVQ
ncbi:MAG TPA: hypothetical protein VGW40_08130 [Allosphingosinicella sp.]|nr:hypothetical protein [Allosphingosinicella sp.]